MAVQDSMAKIAQSMGMDEKNATGDSTGREDSIMFYKHLAVINLGSRNAASLPIAVLKIPHFLQIQPWLAWCLSK